MIHAEDSKMLVTILAFCVNAALGQVQSISSWSKVPSIYSYFSPQLKNDGFNIIFEPHVNGWRQIRMLNDSGSHMVQGDVIIGKESGLTFLAYPPDASDRIPFRQWLKEVGYTRKGVKINMLKTNVVIPALHDVFARSNFLSGPVWFHANIVRGPNQELQPMRPVDAYKYTTSCRDIFPDATVSVGWVSQWSSGKGEQETKYTWRHILDMLEWTWRDEDTNFVVRDVFVKDSLVQILWLASTRPTFTITVWFPDISYLEDFSGVVALRKFSDARRIFYDFEVNDTRNQFTEYLRTSVYKDGIRAPHPNFNRSKWRVIEFDSVDQSLSTIILGNYGAALVGRVDAFLFSEERFIYNPPRNGNVKVKRHDNYSKSSNMSAPPSSIQTQLVSGRVLFIPKRPNRATDSQQYSETQSYYSEFNADEDMDTGLGIYLVTDVHDFRSAKISGGIEISLTFRGKMHIEDRTDPLKSSHYRPKVITQVAESECYEFEVLDKGKQVQFSVRATSDCFGQSRPGPKRGYLKSISLDVLPPSPNNSHGERYVIIQKRGEPDIDLFIDNLQHTTAGVRTYVSANCYFVTLAIFVLFVKKTA